MVFIFYLDAVINKFHKNILNRIFTPMNATKKTNRKYLPANFDIKTWNDLESIYAELLDRKISSSTELEKWMLDVNELEAAVSENFAWRYIKQSCDTENEELNKSYEFFVTE
ncbi:MAG TPA: hypothetical protein VNX01_02000, partial [Bacteroidia bacterium]|nr:hypothetical protein [Bacteroidia bacterium]